MVKQYMVRACSVEKVVYATKFKQSGEFVEFYDSTVSPALCVALVRMGAGDIIAEMPVKDMSSLSLATSAKSVPERCPDCGHLPGERGHNVEQPLPNGVQVRLAQHSDMNANSNVYAVVGHEVHNGLLFYTLDGTSGLFLKSSLVVAKQ